MHTWVVFRGLEALTRALPKARREPLIGIREALRALHGHTSVAVLATTPEETEATLGNALAALDLEAFVKRRLPCSPVHSLPTLLKVDPGHVVVVGISWDAEMHQAQIGGCRVVWLNLTSAETRAAEHVTTVHHLQALPGVLMGWGLLPRQ